MKCKRCGSDSIVKNGFRNQKQSYLCQNPDCNHQFTSETERYTKQKGEIAVLLHCFGLPNRKIAQFLSVEQNKVAPSTIGRWLQKYKKENCEETALKDELVIKLEKMRLFVDSQGFGELTVTEETKSAT